MNVAKMAESTFASKKQYKNRSVDIDSIKTPPHSPEAEQSVLGGLMLDNRAWDQIVDRVREDDFYRYENRLIFNAMSRLIEQNKPLDVLTVAETLREKQELDKTGGDIYLFELANNTPSAANIIAYADIVRERSVLRKLIQTAQDIANSAFRPEGRSINELIDSAERQVFAI